MRGTILFISVTIAALSFGQSTAIRTSDLTVYKHWKVNFSDGDQLLELSRLKNNEAAPSPVMQSAEVKQKIDAQRKRKVVKSKTSYSTTAEDVKPELQDNFNGKPLGTAGIPNDNTMAISNNGIIISAINTTVTILDETGEMLKFRSLYGIVAGQLGILDRYYDPKVTYDPVADRFILVFLEGSTSNDTRIVVGFTETNDPTADWNFYALDGRPLGGATWSDYPIIAHNGTDLYITVNLLRDNESWQEGFVESFIWQVNKQDGYDGEDDLTQNLFSGIEYGGKSVWSICPVQPGLDFNQDNMYLLSVRPDAESNDTVFLHEITSSYTTGGAEHKLTVLKSDIKYGVPPTAYQPLVDSLDFRLQTNDTRVLSATIHKGNIHYVQSTILPNDIRSGIYHGVITEVAKDPVIRGNIISSSTLDYAYPSIAYAGYSEKDINAMMITFSHVGESDFPGTSAVFHNQGLYLNGIYSEVVRIKDGDSIINTRVADTAERWGDYTDIQRKYNEPGVVWACGSFGDENGRNSVWLAKMKVTDELTFEVDDYIVYPNPIESSELINIVFPNDELVNFYLLDSEGSIVRKEENREIKKGKIECLFNTNIPGLGPGMYILSVENNSGKKLHTQKILVE